MEMCYAPYSTCNLAPLILFSMWLLCSHYVVFQFLSVDEWKYQFQKKKKKKEAGVGGYVQLHLMWLTVGEAQ